MNVLALEACLLLGLLATFGVVGVLVRRLDAPFSDVGRTTRAVAFRATGRPAAMPDAV